MKPNEIDDALINQRMIIEELLKRVAMLEKAPFDGLRDKEDRHINIPSRYTSMCDGR